MTIEPFKPTPLVINPVKLSYKQALCLWWAFTWRVTVVGMTIGLSIGMLMGYWGIRSMAIPALVSFLLSTLFSIVFMKSVVEKKMAKFGYMHTGA